MAYGVKLDPQPIAPGLSVRELVDHHLYAYNAARLREACQLFARKIAQPNVTIGVTLSGALTPTGLGTAAIAGTDRSDSSRSLAEAAALETALCAGRNGRSHGAGHQAIRRISLRQRHRRLLRLDIVASVTFAGFRLARRGD